MQRNDVNPWEWSKAFGFSQAVSERLARDQPKAYVATMSKAQRTGKIFIDYFRNGQLYQQHLRRGQPAILKW